jgi:hypothetical protein
MVSALLFTGSALLFTVASHCLVVSLFRELVSSEGVVGTRCCARQDHSGPGCQVGGRPVGCGRKGEVEM